MAIHRYALNGVVTPTNGIIARYVGERSSKVPLQTIMNLSLSSHQLPVRLILLVQRRKVLRIYPAFQLIMKLYHGDSGAVMKLFH